MGINWVSINIDFDITLTLLLCAGALALKYRYVNTETTSPGEEKGLMNAFKKTFDFLNDLKYYVCFFH